MASGGIVLSFRKAKEQWFHRQRDDLELLAGNPFGRAVADI